MDRISRAWPLLPVLLGSCLVCAPTPFIPAPMAAVCLVDPWPPSWPGCGVPISTLPGPQSNSRIVPYGDGAFIVYQDDGHPSGNTAIYLQRLDASGNVEAGWPAGGVLVTVAEHMSEPLIAADGMGAIVTWADNRNTPGSDSWDAFAVRITASGTVAPGWPANGLGLHTPMPPSEQWPLDILEDGLGGAFILYHTLALPSELRLTHVLPGGSLDPIWPVNGIQFAVGAGELCSDGVGGIYLCRRTGDQLWIHRFNAAGTLPAGWEGPKLLASEPIPSDDSFDLDLQDGGVCAAYRNTAHGVRMTIIGADGTTASGYPLTLPTTTNEKRDLTIAGGGPSGGAVVTWREGPVLNYYRRSSTGTVPPGWPVGGTQLAFANLADVNSFPDCNSGTTFTYFANGLRALRIDVAGAVLDGWPATGLLLCGGSYARLIPHVVVADGTGGIFATLDWSSSSTPLQDLDVYALHLNGNGIVDEGYLDNLATGTNSQADLGPVQLTYAQITTAGHARLDIQEAGPEPPAGFRIVPSNPALPRYYDVSTAAAGVPPITICIQYDPAELWGPETELQLLHYDPQGEPPGWTDITLAIDAVNNRICGQTTSLSPFVIVEDISTDTGHPLPSVPRLLANVPNPFNPSTTIAYELSRREAVRLEVLDIRGRLVRTLVDETVGAGRHESQWNGEDASGRRVASGVYCYRITTPTFTATRRMVLVK